MKKLGIPIVLFFLLSLTASCGDDDDDQTGDDSFADDDGAETDDDDDESGGNDDSINDDDLADDDDSDDDGNDNDDTDGDDGNDGVGDDTVDDDNDDNDSTCVPDCSGRDCGEDGCGGSCGDCPTGNSCTDAGVCCPDNYQSYCGENSGGTGCWPTGTDCETVTECPDGWIACPEGSAPYCGVNGPSACCPPERPVFCDTEAFGTACWSEGTVCESVTECNGSMYSCPEGLTGHCGEKEFVCCSDERPKVCENDEYGIGCWSEEVNCDSLTLCGGKWQACTGDKTPQCGEYGFSCCPEAFPVFCDHPEAGAGCWAPDIDCSTITLCGGDYGACTEGHTPNCDEATGAFSCQ